MDTLISNNPLLFLVDGLLTFYVFVLIARGALAAVSADFYNPISQVVFKLTEPVLAAPRKFIPSIGRWDLTCWVFAWLVSALEIISIAFIQGYGFSFLGAAFGGIISFGLSLAKFYIATIFVLAISSWFVSGAQALTHPLFSLLFAITEPVLSPVRRILPTLGMLDLSPLVAIFILYFLMKVIRSIAVTISPIIF